MKLTQFKALTFDCYGTLIDWESGMIEALRPLTDRVGRGLTRDDVLEAHARHESAQQLQTPAKLYRDLLAVVYRRLAEEWGVSVGWAECVAYGRSVANWPAFADSAAALQYLKRRYKLVILSNVDNESFAASNKKLAVDFDAVYTAEDIGSYKPSPRNFEALLAEVNRLGIEDKRLLHVAQSLFHDHVPAKAFGLPTVWINRRHDRPGWGATPEPPAGVTPDWEFPSMRAFAEAAAASAAQAR